MATRTLKPLNRTLTILGASRILVGASCWIAPATTTQIFAMWTLPQATSIVVRTFGARDALIGLWLLTAKSEEERRRAVYFGAAVDASDALSCLMSWYTGDLPPTAALIAGSGALCVVAWARFGIGRFKMGEKPS
jgi:hypothetical protein